MKYLKYAFGNWKRLVSFQIEYSLFTKSGKSILSVTENIIPKKEIIRDYGMGKWNCWNKDILSIYEKSIKNKAEEMLNGFQKKRRNIFDKTILDGGDYIIKCEWYIYPETEDLTYKEYKEMIK